MSDSGRNVPESLLSGTSRNVLGANIRDDAGSGQFNWSELRVRRTSIGTGLGLRTTLETKGAVDSLLAEKSVQRIHSNPPPKPMIKDILLLSGVLFAVVAVGLFLFALMRAPEGTEDKTGFHYFKNGSPVSRPPFAAKSRAKKNENPARHHIPAA